MELNNLTPAKGSVKKEKRIARGQGSGHGGTSTRGHKGAKSRSAYSTRPSFSRRREVYHTPLCSVTILLNCCLPTQNSLSSEPACTTVCKARLEAASANLPVQAVQESFGFAASCHRCKSRSIALLNTCKQEKPLQP